MEKAPSPYAALNVIARRRLSVMASIPGTQLTFCPGCTFSSALSHPCAKYGVLSNEAKKLISLLAANKTK